MTVDDDSNGFIIPPDSTSKGDAAHVDVDFADLYTVIHVSGTNLFLFKIHIYILFFSSTSPSSLLVTRSHDTQELFKP